jgi:hypothetical protein
MSKQVKRVLKNRVLVTLLAVTTVWFSLTALVVPHANACPHFIRTCIYYTDATYTVQCGSRTWPCCGGIVYQDGCTTPFSTCDIVDC